MNSDADTSSMELMPTRQPFGSSEDDAKLPVRAMEMPSINTTLQRFVTKNYKMVVRVSLHQQVQRRRRLEEAQVVDRPIILASRHNFSPSLSFSLHQSHDPILQAAYSILHDFSYSTFSGYMNPLEIEPLFSDDAVFLHQAMFYGTPACAMYAIGRYGMIAKMHLFMHAATGQVFVRDQSRAVELGAWLQTLPLPAGSITGMRGYDCLLAYWEATGQQFEIMKLPAELWIYVFELGFGMDIYPCYSGDRFGQGHNYNDLRGPLPIQYKCVAPPTKSILGLNKSIQGAILPFVEKHTCKCFTHSRSLIRSIGFLPTPLLHSEHLSILELDFTLQEFMLLFAVDIAPFNSVAWRDESNRPLNWGLASHITTLRSVRHLFLRFPALCHDTDDPWANTGGYNPFGISHMSCPKVLVDWILTYAKQYIQKIPRVTLYGYIKNSTKAKWDKILQDERNCNDGNEVHDVTKAKSEIRNWDLKDLGPSCHCTSRCGKVRYERFVPKNKKALNLRPAPFCFDYED